MPRDRIRIFVSNYLKTISLKGNAVVVRHPVYMCIALVSICLFHNTTKIVKIEMVQRYCNITTRTRMNARFANERKI